MAQDKALDVFNLIQSALNNFGNTGGNGFGEVTGLNEKAMRRAEKSNMRQIEHAAGVNYDYGEKAADNAFDRGLMQFQYESAYNTPEAQVQRLKDAGLSVGLMYGGAGTTGSAVMDNGPQGSGAGGQQAKGGTYEATVANQIQSMNIANQMKRVNAETQLMESQAANIDADTANKEPEGELIKANIAEVLERTQNYSLQREGQRLDNEYQEISNRIKNATSEVEIEQALAELKMTQKNTDKIVEEINNLKIDNTYKAEIMKASIGQMKAQTANLWKSIEVSDQLIKLYTEQTTKTNQDWKNSIKALYNGIEQGWENLEQGIADGFETRETQERIQEMQTNTQIATALISAGGTVAGGYMAGQAMGKGITKGAAMSGAPTMTMPDGTTVVGNLTTGKWEAKVGKTTVHLDNAEKLKDFIKQHGTQNK